MMYQFTRSVNSDRCRRADTPLSEFPRAETATFGGHPVSMCT